MSLRQPVTLSASRAAEQSTRPERRARTRAEDVRFGISDTALMVNLDDDVRIEALQKLHRPGSIELRIAGLDAEEELVAAGELEPRNIEDRMVGHRKLVACQHAED